MKREDLFLMTAGVEGRKEERERSRISIFRQQK